MAFFQVLPKYGCNFRYQRCISVQDANTFFTAYYIASLVFVLVHSFFCMLELLTQMSITGELAGVIIWTLMGINSHN